MDRTEQERFVKVVYWEIFKAVLDPKKIELICDAVSKLVTLSPVKDFRFHTGVFFHELKELMVQKEEELDRAMKSAASLFGSL